MVGEKSGVEEKGRIENRISRRAWMSDLCVTTEKERRKQ